jgi:hypothetical protein
MSPSMYFLILLNKRGCFSAMCMQFTLSHTLSKHSRCTIMQEEVMFHTWPGLSLASTISGYRLAMASEVKAGKESWLHPNDVNLVLESGGISLPAGSHFSWSEVTAITHGMQLWFQNLWRLQWSVHKIYTKPIWQVRELCGWHYHVQGAPMTHINEISEKTPQHIEGSACSSKAKTNATRMSVAITLWVSLT